MRRFTGQLTGNLTQVNDMAEGAKGEGRRRKTAVIEKDWRDIITKYNLEILYGTGLEQICYKKRFLRELGNLNVD